MAKEYYMIGETGEAFTTSNVEWHKDAKRVSKQVWMKARKEYCAAQILKFVSPGSKVYTVLRHVAKSGMSRTMSIFVVDKGGEILSITTYVADLCDYTCTKDGYLRADGCGMDMGFSVVYNLGQALWPEGTEKPHGTRNGEPDSVGGYALNQVWL
jgi:hypothetical protein